MPIQALALADDGYVVVARAPKQRQQLHQMALHARDPHVARHDLADHLGLVGVDTGGGAHQLSQLACKAFVSIEFSGAHEVSQGDDARYAKRAVHHRQGLDAPFAQQQRPRLLERRAKFHRHQLARHDVHAAHLRQLALGQRLLGAGQVTLEGER